MEPKKLGLIGATSITLVAMVGTGLFFGPALAAERAGPASILSWAALALITVLVGFVFAELVARHPKSGGVYEFAKQAFGRFPSFITGWTMWLVATTNTSLLIIAALAFAFPGIAALHMILYGAAILVALHVVAYIGLGASADVVDFFAVIMLLFAAGAIIFGVPHVSIQNYEPFFTAAPISLLVALFFIIETNFGWEAASFLAEETQDPAVTIPRAIIISSIIAAILALGLAAVLLGIIPGLSSQEQVLAAFTKIFGSYGTIILRGGVFLALIGSATGNIVAGPRLVQAMAKDKLFIAQLGVQSERTGTPGRAILFQAIVSGLVLLAALGKYNFVLSVMVPLALFMYTITMLSLPVLRKNEGRASYHIPGGTLMALLCALLFIGSIVAYALIEPGALSILLFALSLLLFGLPIYLLLSTYYNPSTQLFFADSLAYPALALESLIVPKKLREKILHLFTGLEGKTVLEFGAGVGSLTMHLAEAVTPTGKVYAVEAGKANIDLLIKRIKKKQHDHVEIIHDQHIINRLHPGVKEIDAVFSLGMLGYIQHSQKVLNEIASVMPEHAPICFMEWVDYFGFIPNPPWISHAERLKQEFADANFSVKIEKVKGLFWNYLLVYGVKSSDHAPYA